jgi:hypothetical protein
MLVDDTDSNIGNESGGCVVIICGTTGAQVSCLSVI